MFLQIILLGELISFFSFLLLFILLIYLIGHLMISFVRFPQSKANDITIAFVKLFTGLIGAITLFAVFKTFFKTSFVAVFFLASWIILTNKISVHNFKKSIYSVEVKSLLLLLVFTTFAFLGILFGWVYSYNDNTLQVIFDFHYYAQVSSFISEYGIESRNFDFFEPGTVTASPYHYGLIWTNSLFADLFCKNHMLSLLLVTLPFLLGLVAFGTSALAQNIFPEKRWLQFMGIIIWATAPFNFLHTGVYSAILATIGETVSTEPKAIFVYLFFIAALIAFVQNKYILGMQILIVLPVFYMPTLPAVFAAVFFTAMFLWYKKLISRGGLIALIAAMLLTGLFLLIFYKISNPANDASMISPLKLLSFHTENNFKGMFGAVGRFILNFAATISPFIIASFLVWNKFKERVLKAGNLALFVFFFALGLVATLHYAFYFPIIDSEQYLTKSFLPLVIVFIILLLLALLNSNFVSRVVAFILLGVSIYRTTPFYYNYHNREHLLVNARITDYFFKKSTDRFTSKTKVIFINDSSFYSFAYRYNFRTYVPFKYFNYYVDPFIATSLDVFPIKDSVDGKIDYQMLSARELNFSKPFYQFVENQKKRNLFLNIHSSRIDFIRKYKVEYIVWDEHVRLDPSLSQLIDSTRIIKDTFPSHHFTNYFIAPLKR